MIGNNFKMNALFFLLNSLIRIICVLNKSEINVA